MYIRGNKCRTTIYLRQVDEKVQYYHQKRRIQKDSSIFSIHVFEGGAIVRMFTRCAFQCHCVHGLNYISKGIYRDPVGEEIVSRSSKLWTLFFSNVIFYIIYLFIIFILQCCTHRFNSLFNHLI